MVSQNVGAFVVRPLALSGFKDVSVKRSLGSVVLDKLFDLAFILLFIGPSALYFAHVLSLMAAIATNLVLFGLFSALALWHYGAIIGWILCILAYRGQIIYEKLDVYGMFGAVLAVFWATFRRLKHVEHLGHIRKHLE